MTPQQNDLIAVWFSCGAASAVVAKKTVEKYGKTANVQILNCYIKEEDPDNRRFLDDVAEWIGRPITILKSSDFPDCSAVSVWGKRKYMSNAHGNAPCTYELKKRVRYAYEAQNRVDWHVMGFTLDEQSRHRNFVASECANTLPVLIDDRTTKSECYRIIAEAGIELPAIYRRGYPNANCIGCVKATSPTYWNLVRREDPEVFESRATQSREIGARLVRVKNKRIFLDELKPTDTGMPIKDMDFECGIFCTPESIFK